MDAHADTHDRLHGNELLQPHYGKPIVQLINGRPKIRHQEGLAGVHSYYERRKGQPVYIQAHNRKEERGNAERVYIPENIPISNIHHPAPFTGRSHGRRQRRDNNPREPIRNASGNATSTHSRASLVVPSDTRQANIDDDDDNENNYLENLDLDGVFSDTTSTSTPRSRALSDLSHI